MPVPERLLNYRFDNLRREGFVRIAMRRFIFLALGIVAALRLSAIEPDARPLAGSWRYDPQRSTELSSWGALKLTIVVNGPVVTLTRQYEAGRRTFEEVTTVDLTKSANFVPVEWWPDNRHIGAYVGGDKTKKMRVRLYDNGRLLRTSADITLATQQGERLVNILADYKVSANGALLTVTELRSTRNEPIVYHFKRITDPRADAESSKGRAE